jgi:hypothetical protein
MKAYVLRSGWLVSLCFALCLGLSLHASAQGGLTQLSQDTFTDNPSQHQTEVEPSVFTFGSTIVTAFQVARIFSGGGADIGFATSKDGGVTWSNGYLPGITIYQGGGTWNAASDASVAYDAKHGVWLISTLPIGNSGTAVAVSRSADGLTWSNPVFVTKSGGPDKNWLVCDNSARSPYYGHCYQEWDSTNAGDLMQMSTSADGGQTWGPALSTAGNDFGIGGLPLVKPGGLVIVPFLGFNGFVQAFTSTNGGASWTAAVNVGAFISHGEAGDLRSAGLPSAAINKGGKVWVAWADCRFRTACSSNDIVYSRSGNGTTWTAVKRVPIDPTNSTVDHFITGMAIQPGTGGTNTHVGLAYYYYPVSNCGNNCQLDVGFIQSSNNGVTWSTPVALGGPMNLSWLPDTFSGRMVADYIGVGFGTGGKAYPVFALANAPVGGLFQEAIYTASPGLDASRPEDQFLSAEGDQPVPEAHSDHGPMEYLDQEHRIPITGQRPPQSRE